ncbi:MAG: Crp/Fnr family transcriptional regulator [Snowella sp.]
MTHSLIPPSFSRTKERWTFDARTNLPQKANDLWKINSGVVRGYTWLEDGSVITLGLWGEGEGVSKTFAQIQPYQLECLTEVEAFLIPWQNSPENINILLSHIQSMQELVIIRSHKTVETMLMALFNWLGKKFGKETSQGQLIDLRLTHQDISDILGTTRVTVTRLLNQLEKQGVIERNPLHRFVLREEEMWHYEI